MKLEVGQFVRTKDGIIAKVDYIDNDTIFFDKELYRTYGDSIDFLEKDNLERIVKTSYNIIDILECGDIIKLFMEDDIDEEDTNIFELIAINYNDNEIGVFNSDFQIEFFPIENLRGILTHEQMEQMAYKIGE